ncbi:MAG: hypothetical protein QXK54_04160 [Ignisphaera sp.]
MIRPRYYTLYFKYPKHLATYPYAKLWIRTPIPIAVNVDRTSL